MIVILVPGVNIKSINVDLLIDLLFFNYYDAIRDFELKNKEKLTLIINH